MKTQKTILWLEDEEDQTMLLVKTFEDNGYRTIVVDNAAKGMELLKRMTPDLLLVDIKLPGIDGLEFFKSVKEIDHLKNVPFVYLTAYNSIAMAMEAKRLGVADYITKPFEVEDLLQRIRAVLLTKE